MVVELSPVDHPIGDEEQQTAGREGRYQAEGSHRDHAIADIGGQRDERRARIGGVGEVENGAVRNGIHPIRSETSMLKVKLSLSEKKQSG